MAALNDAYCTTDIRARLNAVFSERRKRLSHVRPTFENKPPKYVSYRHWCRLWLSTVATAGPRREQTNIEWNHLK